MQLKYVFISYLPLDTNTGRIAATDNPLVDASTSDVHNGGNFQALALTMAFEKTRLSLFLLGKILFAQATEMLNPAYNNSLPPNLAATDPSINYHSKVNIWWQRLWLSTNFFRRVGLGSRDGKLHQRVRLAGEQCRNPRTKRRNA